jgi:hypothetical protein
MRILQLIDSLEAGGGAHGGNYANALAAKIEFQACQYTQRRCLKRTIIQKYPIFCNKKSALDFSALDEVYV